MADDEIRSNGADFLGIPNPKNLYAWADHFELLGNSIVSTSKSRGENLSSAYWFGHAQVVADRGLDFVQENGGLVKAEIDKLVAELRKAAQQAEQARIQANKEHA